MVKSPITLPQIQSLLGGFVDTAGFLTLQGLFTAHVTGNFVTLGAALVLGTSGVAAKLLALPMFCAVIVITRIVSFQLPRLGLPVLPTMMTLKTALLTLGAGLAIALGPFRDGDSWSALATGMVFVSAMAIQNAAHRIHYASAPPTTLMTGSTTQIMIDLADLLRGAPEPARGEAVTRLRRMTPSVAAFALGCAAAATLYHFVGVWSFVVPPLLALLSLTPPVLATVTPPTAEGLFRVGRGGRSDA